MDKKQRDRYLKDNYGKVSAGLAAKFTGLAKSTVLSKWRAMRDATKVYENPKELLYEGRYVFIPQLKAKVKLHKGQTAEDYLTKLNSYNRLPSYSTGVKETEELWYG